MLRIGSITTLPLAWVLASSTSLAAPPAPESSGEAPVAPAPSAPDLVRLKNGGLLRGTISESVPGEYVTIVLITGDTTDPAPAAAAEPRK